MQTLLQVLGRILGIEVLARLARRLPGRSAWVASALVLVVVNLLPLLAVLRGAAGIGDVFLVYWIENVVVWATGIVRIATAQGTGGPKFQATMTVNGRQRPVRELGRAGGAAFFALHYGLFTLVHGVFTIIIVAITGLTGSLFQVLVLAGAITVGHLVSLAMLWFGRGERRVVSPATAMFAPYPRMLALHVAIIGGFFFLLGGPGEAGPLSDRMGENTGVALLCGLKLLIDLGFHARLLRRPDPVEGGDGLYGPPAGPDRTVTP